MNQSQRRATASTREQVSYIKGCEKLQTSIWRLCHRDTLKALSDRIAHDKFKQAILVLMDARQRLRKQYLRNYMQKWNNLAQMMSLSISKEMHYLKEELTELKHIKDFYCLKL